MARQPSFGLRVRALRRKRGLSQVDLAGDVLSPSAISLLEAGRREPSMATIEALAAQLGCSPQFLADGVGRLHVDTACQLVVQGELALQDSDPELAAQRFREAMLSGPADPWLVVRGRLGLAAATEAGQRFEEAVEILERLVGDLQKQGDGVPLVVSVALARTQRAAGRLRQSIATARAGLERTEQLGLSGLDECIELGTVIVGATADGGDLAGAAAEARSLLDNVAAPLGRAEQARAYRQASGLAFAQGAGIEALYLAERATAIGRETEVRSAPVTLRMALAWLLMRQQQSEVDTAQVLLVDARRELEGLGDRTTLVCCETQLAQVALARGRPEEGVRWAQTALERSGDDSGVEQLHALLALGECQLAAGDRDAAIARFNEVTDAMGEIEDSRERAAVWGELGRLLHQAGEAGAALRAYNRALEGARTGRGEPAWR
jgi:tetratricopeptide (TPR) repeat protein/transcriptional regulator with XRE-family HTH domain